MNEAEHNLCLSPKEPPARHSAKAYLSAWPRSPVVCPPSFALRPIAPLLTLHRGTESTETIRNPTTTGPASFLRVLRVSVVKIRAKQTQSEGCENGC